VRYNGCRYEGGECNQHRSDSLYVDKTVVQPGSAHGRPLLPRDEDSLPRSGTPNRTWLLPVALAMGTLSMSAV
jgi:hypothetical protein